MRPTIQMFEPDLIASILAEAKRIMAEIGMDIRGPKMRQRLIDAGLPTDANGRVLFPTDVVNRAIETAPKSFTLYNRRPAARRDRRLERALHPRLERPQDHGSPHGRDAPCGLE